MIYLTCLLAEITHWPEETIRYMPYYKVLSYVHFHNIRNGLATEWRFTEGRKKHISREQFKTLLHS